MPLKVQIITLGFSFFYGIVFSFLLTINYKLIYNNKKSIKIISSLFFILVNVLFYFLVLKRINNAIVHPYFLFFFFLGFIGEEFTVKVVANHKKR